MQIFVCVYFMMLSYDASSALSTSKPWETDLCPTAPLEQKQFRGRAMRKGLVWLGCWSSDVFEWLINVSGMKEMLGLMCFLWSRAFFCWILCCSWWNISVADHTWQCATPQTLWNAEKNPVLNLLLQYEGAVPCAAKWRSSLDMAGAGGNRQLGSEQVEFS